MPSQSVAAIQANITGWTVPLDYRLVHTVMKELKIGQYQTLNNISLINVSRHYWMWIAAFLVIISFISAALFYVFLLNKKLRSARLIIEKTNETLEDKIKLRTQELTASEEKYRIVADNTHDWEYWCDPEDIFIYSCPSCKDITGYDRSEFFKNSQLLNSLIHPEDLQKFEDHRNEEESSFTVKKLEFRIIDRSGEERWLSHICKPIFNQDTYLGYRASNRDITLSKRVQLELLQSEELLQVVFDSAPAIMLLINEHQSKDNYFRLPYFLPESLQSTFIKWNSKDLAN
ncbi:MAG: PAS domain-containing protein [Proteobacteria bacterium]|nr:PAS domain-containing protein [Pseudomonadota bacterium]